MMSPTREKLWLAVAPGLFVVLWSSGFIGAKYGLPYIEPLTYLLLRFAFVIVLLLVLALALRRPWPHNAARWGHIAVAGILIHAGYLSGVFIAIHRGMPAGIVAVIVGIQPLLTAFISARMLGERLARRQWFGLVLGFAGVVLVVFNKLGLSSASGAGIAFSLLALVSITLGTVYQKRYCAELDIWSGSVIQFVAAGLVMLPFALAFETMRITWSGELVFALTWLIFVLSLGAISLLHMLIRRGAATRVSTPFYLVPPSTALLAFLIFGESLSLLAIAGMVLAAAGVAIAVRPARS